MRCAVGNQSSERRRYSNGSRKSKHCHRSDVEGFGWQSILSTDYRRLRYRRELFVCQMCEWFHVFSCLCFIRPLFFPAFIYLPRWVLVVVCIFSLKLLLHFQIIKLFVTK